MSTGNKICIGEFWLTEDGTENTHSCDLEAIGLPALKMKWWGNASRNARGNPVMNLTEVAGAELAFQIPMLDAEIFNGIVELFDDALDTDENFALIIEGEAGNYDLTAMPEPENSVTWKEVIEGKFLDVEIRVITTVEE